MLTSTLRGLESARDDIREFRIIHPQLWNGLQLSCNCSRARQESLASARDFISVFRIMSPQLWNALVVSWVKRHWDILESLLESARKSSWKPAGVEPVHKKPADINHSSIFVVQIQSNSEFGVGGANQLKGCRNPTSKKLLVRALPKVGLVL